MRVIGTAGHVDHGKSTLVQALSGIDPDRLAEEKARGMTIDLGFAWIDLPLLRDDAPPGSTESVGIVDVPGHIDFIKNMLAGVGGIDAALLVVAADEGVMPQTREHLAILDLLAAPNGVVALTKVDLIDDPEWLDLIELDLAELLQSTVLADAPIVRVSGKSGAGLDELRLALASTLGSLPPRRNRARPRLPIDRVFSLSGFGTIVTGTLSDGYFSVGDPVEILPAGLSARIRGLQTHRRPVERGEPGSRLAINLSGVGTDELHRGEVVVKPGTLRSTKLIDVSVRMLADAPRLMVHNLAVDFFSGASETPARVRLLGAQELGPGDEGWLQLRLERPVVVAAGDRYILRQPSPSATLGGGVVLDPHPRRRWKRFDPAVIQRLETLARGAPDEILLQTLSRTPFCSADDLFGRSGLDLDAAQSAYEELRAAGAVVELDAGGAPVLLTLARWEETLRALDALLDEFHAQQPLRRGMPRGEARNRLSAAAGAKLSPRLFNTIVEQAIAANRVQADDALIWRAGFEVTLSPAQKEAAERTLKAFAAAPFSPPNEGETRQLLGDDDGLLEMLVEQGDLVRLGNGVLLRRQDFETMTARIQEHLRRNGTITLAETRDLFHTSRKFAQAVLEELDARRITRREGDVRVLRGG
jgi:selenocysteine-specific elongation factor